MFIIEVILSSKIMLSYFIKFLETKCIQLNSTYEVHTKISTAFTIQLSQNTSNVKSHFQKYVGIFFLQVQGS